MSSLEGEARLTSFLVKVASRCNLDCDYCYVYHHADQGWRTMPPLLGQGDRDAFAERLAAYVEEAGIRHCVVVFHGGEPLLMGSGNLAAFAKQIRAKVSSDVQLDFSMQTNGLLLTEAALRELHQAGVGVSLSLDGPKEINDLHRVSRRGRSSFEKALLGLEILKARPEAFAGVIAVIDPRASPRDLLAFFDGHGVPRLDFLLPDAHHLRPPPGRAAGPDIYERWLIEAFDAWFDDYPHLQLRTFEALLDAAAGLPSQTDAFGFGDVSLITIETDGTFHDLDVLKVVAPGASRLVGSVRDTTIADVARSQALRAHRLLLQRDGLCGTCQDCDIVEICGGGAVPHRYGANGFANPTVYCSEMQALVTHVRTRVSAALAAPPPFATAHQKSRLENRLAEFERAESSLEISAELLAQAELSYEVDLRQALSQFSKQNDSTPGAVAARMLLEDDVALRRLAAQPGTVAWSRAMLTLGSGRSVLSIDGTVQRPDADYIDVLLSKSRTGEPAALSVHSDDVWLRKPFGEAIYFEGLNVVQAATVRVQEALDIISAWRPAVARELLALCHAVQFIRDPEADPDKIVSFSDNSVPGALYVSVRQGDKLIDAYDLADSLIHEYRHQKLYLLERDTPTVEQNSSKVISPWREDLRPPSGLFHAIFVFVELRRFWLHVRATGDSTIHRRADNQLADTNANLEAAFRTLDDCRLTPTGKELAVALKAATAE